METNKRTIGRLAIGLLAVCLLSLAVCLPYAQRRIAEAQTPLEVTEAERMLVQNHIHNHPGDLIDVIVESGNQAIWDKLVTKAKDKYQERIVTKLVDMADELGVSRETTIQQLVDAVGHEKAEL